MKRTERTITWHQDSTGLSWATFDDQDPQDQEAGRFPLHGPIDWVLMGSCLTMIALNIMLHI